jgi:hypothetical protein
MIILDFREPNVQTDKQSRRYPCITPQKAGQTSVGVRFNKVNYFKGAVRKARMTPRALRPSEFLRK